MEACVKNNIKSIRELKNFTQEYMASELGITQAAYSKIEKGKTALCFDKLERIAEILDFSLVSVINFDPAGYLKKVSDAGQDIGRREETDKNDIIMKLYKDKAALLEQLLDASDLKLDLYRKKFGPLQ